MTNKPILIFVGIVCLAIIIGGLFINNKMTIPKNISFIAGAKAQVYKNTYDWGKISMQNGKVDAVFTIQNNGTADLKLYNTSTSCHCTTAQIIIGSDTSPLFGMNTKSPYVSTVPPGGKADLKVVFDPSFHGPNGVGSIRRQIIINTNDVNSPKLEFSLSASVSK